MENMQKIQDYIAKNQIKSSFIGGYNKAEVHKLLNTVLEMFEAELKEQQEMAEKREAEFLAGLDAVKAAAEENAKMADALIVDLNKTIVSLTEDLEKAEEKMGNIRNGLSDLLEMVTEAE